jgi:hypothetical protein
VAVPDLTTERHAALMLAVDLHQGVFAQQDFNSAYVVATADLFWEFLTAPVALLIAAGRVVDQTTGRPSTNPGGVSMVAIKDSEKFQLSVQAFDAKGNEVQAPTDVTFTSSDTTILTITDPDASGAVWAVAGNPGSATVTGDWPDSPHGDLQGTLAVDVTTGDAASLVVNAGAAEPQ